MGDGRDLEGPTILRAASRAGLAAIAAALATTPAPAAMEAPWARIGEWQVAPLMPGLCYAWRDYPGGTSLSFWSDPSGGSALLALNDGWSARRGAYRVSLVQGGRRRTLRPGGESLEGRRGLDAKVSRASTAALRAAGAILEVEAPGGGLLTRLDLAGLAAAADRLADCGTQAATAAYFPPPAPPPPLPPTGPGKRRPAHPRIDLGALISPDDYPAAAIRARDEGIVDYRLDIDPAGGVTGCSITGSSGSAVLDSATCRLLLGRGRLARFAPARDRKGRRAAGSYSGSIVWRLPEPARPPPPRPHH